MEFEHILFEVEDEVGVITLNRPEARNALSEEMRGDFDRLLPYLQAEPGRSVKAVVLTCAGPAFSAGGDIQGTKCWARNAPTDSRNPIRGNHPRLYAVATPAITIAGAVQGARPEERPERTGTVRTSRNT